MKNIESIMNPRSVAVVGATSRPASVGRAVTHNILNAAYRGILYPVNPTQKSVLSVKAYPSLLDIPDEVDMAVVIVPAGIVSDIVDEAAEKGVKGVIVITAGFKEVGGKGVELENKLKEQIKNYDIRVVGPNCLGIMNTNPGVSLNASFATKMAKRGSIAFISQSGAVCTAVLDFAAGRNIGFSRFISFGNKADVSEVDLLRYLKDDPDTRVICMYIEDISDGREFIEVARDITWNARKPIFAVKSGRSAEGAKAAASHTGSLAGSDEAYDAIFFQSGIQRVEGIEELFNYSIAFARQPIPKGNKVAIVTNSGGPGIMATDAAMRYGLHLARLSEETKATLRENLPPTANVNNPVDVIGDADHKRYEAAMRAVLEDDNVDGAIVILTPTAMVDILETAQILPSVAKGIDKPILPSFMGIVDVSAGVKFLEENNFPNYAFPEEAVRAMRSMVRFTELFSLDKRKVKNVEADSGRAGKIIAKYLDGADRHMMPQNEAHQILECYGFPLLRSVMAHDASEAGEIASDIGFPVAMKIMSADVIHKFDAGGVMLKIMDKKQAEEAYDKIIENVGKYDPDARIDGILVEQMAKGGVEVIIGATRDPKFGPICMFGLGGTFVESMKDVSFRLAPMWEISAELMIKSIKAYRILQGVRGMPHSDTDAIKDCIIRLSQMVSENKEIAEIDINPLIVYPRGEGCVVADSRMLLKKRTP